MKGWLLRNTEDKLSEQKQGRGCLILIRPIAIRRSSD
jgi:hypothetical protein